MIVHHAERAGLEDVVADHALVAARRAAALTRTARRTLTTAAPSDFADRLEPGERGTHVEELAEAAYHVNRLEEAFPAIDGAIRIHRERGDVEGVVLHADSSRGSHWFAGDGDVARAKALEAIEILEPLRRVGRAARAYSGLSQHAMLAQDTGQALVWGHCALELATRLGDDRTRAHAAGEPRHGQDAGRLRGEAGRCSRRTRSLTPRRRARGGGTCPREPRLHPA